MVQVIGRLAELESALGGPPGFRASHDRLDYPIGRDEGDDQAVTLDIRYGKFLRPFGTRGRSVDARRIAAKWRRNRGPINHYDRDCGAHHLGRRGGDTDSRTAA